MKKPVNFRLSEADIKFMKAFENSFALNQTAFLEMLIMLVRKNPDVFANLLSKEFLESIKSASSDSV